MNIENNIKLWSTLGMRATFGLIAMELAKKHPDLMITTSDVSTSAGLDRYKKKYPEQFVDVGIAEQNLIGISAGLSSEGFKVISTTFAPFQTLRCTEQIKVNLGYMKNKICMVGLASGLVLGNLGFTHCCIEDIGALRSIPNISIVAPSDPFELFKVLNEAVNYKDSVYIRLTAGSNTKIINSKDYKFEIGKAIEILPGEDVAIIGCGNILGNCLKAASLLKEKKIHCSVINMHTIKPIDEEKIKDIARKNKLIVTVEEHNILGGLGTSVAEVLASERNNCKLVRVGINDFYSSGGSYEYLQNIYGLSVEKIIQTVTSHI
jgi:transketolase|tara:strand:- start:7960 stop:8919 length:960 start_codon:yes stop_codon:yes gene_type:complete